MATLFVAAAAAAAAAVAAEDKRCVRGEQVRLAVREGEARPGDLPGVEDSEDELERRRGTDTGGDTGTECTGRNCEKSETQN